MSVEEILLDEATRVATSLEGGLAILEVELLAFERRKIETEAKREPVFSISGQGHCRAADRLCGGPHTSL